MLVARGAHHDAIRDHGLLIRSPEGEVRVPAPVVADVDAAGIGEGDVVLLAVKVQDTPTILDSLAAAPRSPPIVCLQNGLDHDPQALHRLQRLYAVPVQSPAAPPHPRLAGVPPPPPHP